MNVREIDSIVKNALKEDLPQGDITSESVISPDSYSQAYIRAKEAGVLAGMDVAEKVFKEVDSNIVYEKYVQDGDKIAIGDRLARVSGSSTALLKGERTALNFLQRMSGIATLTNKFVEQLKGTQTKLLDTRKTTPGLRVLEKYAVKMGGGENHRFNLSEMVMLKDNHLKLVGSITKAVQMARDKIPEKIKIEVETTNLDEVKEAVRCGVDMIMLDNMSLEEMKEAIAWVKGKVPLEVSGNVELVRIKKSALLGVDYISVGALTHSFKSLDISMDFL